MYKLVNNEELTPEIKEAFKHGITRAYVEVVGKDIIIDEENYLKDVKFEELRFVPDQGIIGQAVAKRITLNFNNVDNNFNIQDEELDLYIGAEYNNEVYYIYYGRYIVQHPQNENTTDNTSMEALDYMSKFNITYQDRVEYPCSLLELTQDICLQAGVELGHTNFRNAQFEVENNQFIAKESCRDILKAIGMCAFSWARIGADNKLYFDFNVKEETNEIIGNEEYYNLNFDNKEYGPVDRIILNNSQIEEDNIPLDSEELIEEYGIHELVITDNPFAYTEEKREELKQAGANLFGFRYVPINSSNLIGYAFLDCTDFIEFEDMQNNSMKTYIFNHTINYQGILSDEMQSPAMTETETKYIYKPSPNEAIKRVEIRVDKANAQIDSIVSDDGIIAQQNISINGIRNEVSSTQTKLEELEDGTVKNDNFNSTIETLKTMIEQGNDLIEFKFQQATNTTNNLANQVSDNQQLLEEYIRFKGALIELGRVGNDFTAELSNTELAFLQNGSKIAYISNNKMYITDAEVQRQLTIGHFAFIPRSNGNLSFNWIG